MGSVCLCGLSLHNVSSAMVTSTTNIIVAIETRSGPGSPGLYHNVRLNISLVKQTGGQSLVYSSVLLPYNIKASTACGDGLRSQSG